jgi:hypothetical protein
LGKKVETVVVALLLVIVDIDRLVAAGSVGLVVSADLEEGALVAVAVDLVDLAEVVSVAVALEEVGKLFH